MRILNTGNRTDIPAFFSDWFFNRIQEGFVCVRNPYFPHQVTKYILDPQVIDIQLVFDTFFQRFEDDIQRYNNHLKR